MINNIWDLKAKFYKYRSQSFFGKILNSENRVIKKMISYQDFSEKTIVDLGAGLGNAGNLIDNGANQNIFAIDYSKSMLKKNVQLNPYNIPLLANAEKLPFKTNSIDFVFVIGLMEYIADKNSTLKEISRVLKPNAKAVITFSPKNIFTLGRLLWGSSLFPSNDADNVKLLTSKFQILTASKTFMQMQYLIKKP